MGKVIIGFIVALLIGGSVKAQLTGTKTIPGNYPTISAAIADLNSAGVGTGGVVFNVAAGYTEILNSSLAGYITTQTGSMTNPITFTKSGSGANPLITASSGKGSMDAIIAVVGCDYVTFNGIDLAENWLNPDPMNMMEWGYAILKASETNGSQNITIHNCTVTLEVNYTSTVGIYAGNHTISSPSQLVVSMVSGANSRLKIFSNTIQNCYSGICLNGYNDPTAPYAYYDQENEIGKDGGNTITNVAGLDVDAGYGIFTQYQNTLKVANNNITSTMGGSGTPYGICLTNADNASYDLYGNYVSIQFYGPGTTSFYPVWCDMGANGTSNVVNVYNNTVTGCLFPAFANSYTFFMQLANLGVTASVYGNNVTNNITGASDVTATGRIRYIYCSKASLTPGPLDLHDNTVTGNSRIQITPGSGLTQVITAYGSGTNADIYNNTITNNVIASNGGTYLLYVSFDNGTRNIYNNLISNISQAEGAVYCLYNYNASTNSGNAMIHHNRIDNIEGVTSSISMFGLYNAASIGISYYYNNFISDLRTPAANYSSNAVAGLYISSGATGFYNNSIYLNCTSTGANFSTAALYAKVGNDLDLRNNILVNTSSPRGSGKTTVLCFNAANLVSFSALSNYNNLFAGTPGASRLIFSDGTNNDQTLATYKARVYPRETQSVTEMPTFENIIQGSTDLHLKPSTPSQCEAGGNVVSLPIAIADDFDGDPRFPNTGYPHGSFLPNAPDIGADEFGGEPIDLTPPAIIYTPLANTGNGNARTLTAEIKDGTGVPVLGNGLPVLYWRINANPYQGVTGIHVSGNVYSFTFGAGAIIGDVVSYYIAAQDLAPVPNVTAFPTPGAAGFTLSPPACTTPPSTPPTYSVVPGIAGVFHVGVGKNYTRLTDAANDINSKVINGPITLFLDDAVYPNEFYPVTFNSNPGSSEVNSITIRPNPGISPMFSTSMSSDGVLALNGIDYLVLDGSNNGTSSKNLSLINASSASGAYAIAFKNPGSDPATHNTVKNCILKCQPANAYTGSIAVHFFGTAGGYDHNVIDNNTICSAFTGIRLWGISSAINHDCQITNNIIGSNVDTDVISDIGISLEYSDNTLISGNDIMGPLSGSLNIGQTGIVIETGCTNTKVRKNKIHDFFCLAEGWGAYGIWYNSDGSTITEISNNLVYDIKAPGMNPGTGGPIVYGMFFRTGGNVKILHNTINLTGDFLAGNADASSGCLGFHSQASAGNFEVRNNILRNGMQLNGSSTTSMGRAYGIMISLGPNTFSTINNNDYFIDGYNGAIAQQFTAIVGTLVDFPTLATWQSFTGQEASSVTIDPTFTSSVNFRPTNPALNNNGAYLSLVPTDFTGVLRNDPSDIGVYEFGNDPYAITGTASSGSGTTADISGTVNAAGLTVYTYFDYGTTANYGNTISAYPALVSGSTTTPIQASLTGLSGSTTYHYRARVMDVGGLTAFGQDMTFTTGCGGPAAPGLISGPTVVEQGQSGVNYSVTPVPGATGYAWNLPAGATIASGANTPNILVDFSLFAISGSISVSALDSCGTGPASPLLGITVVPVNTTVTGTVTSGQSNCYNAIGTLTVAGNGTTFEVLDGGNATFIAGEKILFLPGTFIHTGGYMHGYITGNGEYCTNPANPTVNSPSMAEVETSIPAPSVTQEIRAYPNPTTGSFIITTGTSQEAVMVRITIFNLNGVKVLEKDVPAEKQCQISLASEPAGIYIVHVVTEKRLEMLKLIKL